MNTNERFQYEVWAREWQLNDQCHDVVYAAHKIREAIRFNLNDFTQRLGEGHWHFVILKPDFHPSPGTFDCSRHLTAGLFLEGSDFAEATLHIYPDLSVMFCEPGAKTWPKRLRFIGEPQRELYREFLRTRRVPRSGIIDRTRRNLAIDEEHMW
ncbi:hypothetical protein BDN72DRAFT_901614 [Pluteus cervinus]|uniref:Uncharacterized protein n=1 Tax=Pluteus cervinus TaxID=181527 RepID=A0ACD3AFA9_9AGAR|nr:hypothetical protein BDN72DRAFT_901614 [Pluteus cervinus]